MAALAAVMLMAPIANAATAPGYEEFSDCPDKTVSNQTGPCVVSTTTGGHLKLGSKDTPITDPIVLAGRVNEDGDFLLGSFDGGRQRVPGGIIGITGLDWLSWLFPFSLLTLDAEAQLAGTPGNPLVQPVVLPLKIRLVNALLSSNCYIGSNSNPVTLNLMATGGVGGFDPNLPDVLRISDAVFEDHTFSVPAASGCDLIPVGLIDALVNLQAGLPSASGNNDAVQEGDVAIGAVEAVYPPDGFEQ